MAITNDQQVNLWKPPSGTADSVAGDGAPLHSMLIHDAVRNVNTMAARCEPQASFAMDATYGMQMQGLIPKGATKWIRSGTVPASGLAFLGQMPVVIPQGATSLNVTAGIRRWEAIGSVDHVIHVNVTKINVFLSSAPLYSLDTFGTFPVGSQAE